MERKCDHEGCKEKGVHRAPKDRTLKSYYWFCQKHAKEYNKAWNYYKDATADEVEKDIRAQQTWDRPTWKLGQRKQFIDPLGIFHEMGFKGTGHKPKPKRTMEERKALSFFELKEGFSKKELTQRYRFLAKKYHPDLKNGDEALFKKTVEYYQILKKHLPPK